MGLKPSSDIFNIQSDKCLQGVVGALKSVDDVLTQASSYRDLKERLINLFCNFEQFNVKIKTSKFCVGESVCFGGFLCGANEEGVYVKPGPDRIAAIAEIKPPITKMGLRAFLGMVPQLKSWTPNLSFLSKNLRAHFT